MMLFLLAQVGCDISSILTGRTNLIDIKLSLWI